MYYDFQAQQGRRAHQSPLTPEQLWEHYKKLHLNQQLTAVAVPITEFVKLVPEPSESDLREFFDKYKNNIGDEFGNPGFLESPKVRVAYLVASNLEAYEKGHVTTDQEVVDYYLQHKEEFRAGFEFPESSTTTPADPNSPADATSPENAGGPAKIDLPVVPGLSAEKTETGEPKPADPSKEEEKKPEEKKEEAAAKEPSCGEDPTPAQDEPAKPDAAKEDEPKSDKPETEAKPEAAAEEKKEDKPATPVKPDAEASPGPGSPPPGLDIPGLPGIHLPAPDGAGTPRTPAAPRYRELTEDLKLEIREKILLNKAFEKMGEAADEAAQFMGELDLEYAQPNQPSERWLQPDSSRN